MSRRRRLSRKEEVSAWSPAKQRADVSSAQSEKNTGSQVAERCLHILYTVHRASYIGSEINELGLSLMHMYSEGAMDYLKLRTY